MKRYQLRFCTAVWSLVGARDLEALKKFAQESADELLLETTE